MTINIYDLGDKPRITNTFAINGTVTDPTAVVMIVRCPDGERLSYLYSSGFSNQGNWDASANSPALADGTGTAGHYYAVSTASTRDLGSGSQTFAVGDYVAYDGDIWLLIPAPQTGTLTKASTGIYYYDLPLHQEGVYLYRFEGFGTVHAAAENRLRVTNSSIR